jgi:hypothetical protein
VRRGRRAGARRGCSAGDVPERPSLTCPPAPRRQRHAARADAGRLITRITPDLDSDVSLDEAAAVFGTVDIAVPGGSIEVRR